MTNFATLFGKRTFGSSLFNGNMPSSALSDDLFVFDSFSLQRDNGLIVLENYNDPMPSRELLGESNPRGNGMYLNGAFWRKTPISAKGYLLCSTVAEMLEQRDLMKLALSRTEKYLDITEAGRVRRYVATLSNPDTLFPKREHYNTTWLPWSAVFECRTPFASDRAYTSENFSMTTTPDSIGIVPTGTAESDGVVVLVFDSATNVTGVTVQRLDPNDGSVKETIVYTGAIAAGDVLVFDGEQKKLFLNSAESNYTGQFLTLPVMSNLVKITVAGTSPTFDILCTVKWKNRYL